MFTADDEESFKEHAFELWSEGFVLVHAPVVAPLLSVVDWPVADDTSIK
jgi:hypothetical protein